MEDANAFLEKHNVKTLVEWLTAEIILNRPEDPLDFIRDTIEDKVAQRMGQAYKPTDVVEYAKECYAEASGSADEKGRIDKAALKQKKEARLLANSGGGGSSNGNGSSTNDPAELKRRLNMMETVLHASRDIFSNLDPMVATKKIVKNACDILNCDRCTIFRLDPTHNELVLIVAKGTEKIKLPMGQGVAGSVASTGSICNIPDAYADERFSDAADKATGYKTESILASPVKNWEGNIVGVIQAINRKGNVGTITSTGEDDDDGESKQPSTHGSFTVRDEEMLSYLALQAGIALNNATLFHAMSLSQERVRCLLDIIQSMHNNLGINSLMFTITQRAHTLVAANRCTMFLLDEEHKELWSLQGEVNLRIPMDKGIAGECCIKNTTINIPDAYEDDRFNQDIDKKSGYKTETILCMPARDTEGKVVGVIQLINKDEGSFDEEDEEMMESFLIIAGPMLAQSELFQRSKNHADDNSTEFTGSNPHTNTRSVRSLLEHHHEPAIREDEEEENE